MRKHWKFYLACGLVLTFAALAEPPEAMAQRGTVEGVVTLDGQPVKDAIIQFENLGRAGKPIKAKTNKKGRFNRYFIPIGRYKVSVHIDNDKVWENVVDVCSPGSQCLGGKDTRVMPPIALRTSKGGGGNDAAYAKLNEEFQQGRDMFTKKNFTMAALAFQRAAKLDPDQHVIHAFLGDTYRQMRKYDQAVGSYQNALTALGKKKPNPNSEVAYRRSMASALAMAGKGTEAYAAAAKIAELAPEKLSDVYFRIAAAFVRTGRSAEAVEAFRKSLKADPKNAEAQYQLAVTLVSMATVTEDGQQIPAPGTLEAYQRYLEIAPTGSHALEAKTMITAFSQKVKTTFSAEEERKKKNQN